MNNCLSKHSYPKAQGPAVPPLDRSYGSDHKAFADRTEYVHSNQECFEWLPAEIGLDIFGETVEYKINDEMEIDAVFEVRKFPQLNIKGAASLKDMSIVYTCKLQNCIVHCPCTVCMNQKGVCREAHVSSFPVRSAALSVSSMKLLDLQDNLIHSKIILP